MIRRAFITLLGGAAAPSRAIVAWNAARIRRRRQRARAARLAIRLHCFGVSRRAVPRLDGRGGGPWDQTL